MRYLTNMLVLFAILVGLSACNLPRGAAVQSQILRGAQQEEADFAVVPVTRANTSAVKNWPATGWSGHYHWLSNGKGPASNIIRTGDYLDMVIWDSQENSLITAPEQNSVEMRGLVVSPSGTIFVPYVDEVVVRGMTPDAARRKIQSQLEMIVPSAQVQLGLRAGQGNSVDMVRGVAAPGTYPLPGRDYTILSAISQAGGINNTMRNPLVRLIRGSNSYEIPAESLLSDASKNVALRGGDKVVVDEDKRSFTSLGSTGSRRLIYFEKEHTTALEALSIAGGLNPASADPKGVLILRDYPADAVRTDGTGPSKAQVVFTMDLTNADGLFAARKFQINPGDTVLASESPINAASTIVGLLAVIVGVAANVSN